MNASAVTRILVLGGTAEGSALARQLHGREGIAVTTSLAGRTSRPVPVPGDLRVGGFGGPEGLAAYLSEQGIVAVVDATHPFADAMPHHAAGACAAVGVPRLRLLRPEWPELPGDTWHRVADLDAAVGALAAIGARRVFITTGRTDLAPYARLRDVWFLVRSVEPPDPLPLTDAQVILDRGPFGESAERGLLKEHRIDALVTKNSGGPAGAKLAAARSLALPVVVVERPPAPAGPTVATVTEAEAWVCGLVT